MTGPTTRGTGGGRFLARVWQDVPAALARASMVPLRARQMAAVDVGETPREVVHAENKLQLVRYEPRTERRGSVPVLLVSAFVNRPYVLDLQPDRSVVRRFLERGFDVYLVDWGEPSRLDARLGLGDYVARYLLDCVDAVRERTGEDALHLFGYCTGATLSAIFAALYPDRVRTLGMLAPVLDFDTDEGIFGRWRRGGYDDPERVVDVYGTVPGELLSVGFTAIDPVEYHLARYLRLWEDLDDEAFVTHFARRLRWGFDSVDVAGELYEQFLADLCRDNRLVNDRLSVNGTTVEVSTVDVPVLVVVGTEDRFVPREASLPFLDAISSDDTGVIEFPTDHVGLSVGERAHEELWPQVCDWFARRSGEAPSAAARHG